jgi:aspartate/glutamate racemase
MLIKLQLEAVHAAAELLQAPAQALLRYGVKLVIYCANTIYNHTGDLQLCQSTA